MRYIALRGDFGEDGHIRELKSFAEEDLKEIEADLAAGSRRTYVEVMFYAAFYEQYLTHSLRNRFLKPADIFKKIRDEIICPHEIIQVLNDIKDCKYSGAVAELYFIAKSNELMSHILHLTDVPYVSEDIEAVSAVVMFIDDHCHESIRQSVLVAIAKMSATKLKRMFRQMTGRSITDYILCKRSEKAASLLANTDMSVAEISATTGYLTPTGFASSFRKQTGMSPSVYRKYMKFNCMENPSSRSDILPGLTFVDSYPVL
jgi:AraC-like DNA-binding protein